MVTLAALALHGMQALVAAVALGKLGQMDHQAVVAMAFSITYLVQTRITQVAVAVVLMARTHKGGLAAADKVIVMDKVITQLWVKLTQAVAAGLAASMRQAKKTQVEVA